MCGREEVPGRKLNIPAPLLMRLPCVKQGAASVPPTQLTPTGATL